MAQPINSKDLVESYIFDKDWRTKENSNSPKSFGGLNKYITGEVSKNYWLNHVYTERIKTAYLNGDLHIHDLGGLTIYCCGFSVENILLMGVQGVDNIPTSKPASHFGAILSQIVNLATVYQNEIMGAVAFNSLDTLLSPFIYYDKLSKKEVKQDLQNFIYAINSNSRGGAEPAFTNITLDITPPVDIIDKPVIVKGEYREKVYGDFQKEMDVFNEVFTELMLEGDGVGKPFAYPIITYNIGGRFDWDNPKNDAVFEMAGKFGYPYFSNYLNSEMDESDIRSMCPLTSDTKIFVRSPRMVSVMEIGDAYNNSSKTEYEVFTELGWVHAKFNQFPMTRVYEIKFSNGSTVKMGENHLQPTRDFGTLLAKELKTNMWIPFNKTQFGNNLGSKEFGFAIGAYIGDGSYDYSSVIYSLCASEKDDLTEIKLKEFWQSIGFSTKVSFNDKNVRSLRVSVGSKHLIEKYVIGTALTKELKNSIFNTSVEFRKGVIDGLIATDGSRSKRRIYTSSSKMVEGMTQLFTSLGLKSLSNYVDERDGRLGDSPNYRIDHPLRGSYGELFSSDDLYNYYKIVEIKEVNSNGYLYCVELDTADKLFSLANGLITHNCRLRLDLTELRRRNGGLFGSGDSTGSIGVVTINLPRIGYLARGNREDFYNRLDQMLVLAKDSLEIKRKFCNDVIIKQGLLPAFMRYVGTLDNHFLTIGELGKNEMCENFLGKNILSKEGKEFALEVGNHIREKLVEFQEETGHLYNYEATPAEGTCYRLARKDRDKYKDIITRGTEDAPYYTNSCHIPVSLVTSIKRVYDNQEELQVQYTGGTVIHNYMDGEITGKQAKHIIKTLLTNYKVPYTSLSPITRYCPDHGYVSQRVNDCPNCGKELEKFQRITGYTRKVKNFNLGKNQEFRERNQHKTATVEGN